MDPIRTASVLVWLSSAALALCAIRVTRRVASGVLTALAGVCLATWQTGLLNNLLPPQAAAPAGAANLAVLIAGTLVLTAHVLLLSRRDRPGQAPARPSLADAARAELAESMPPAGCREVHRRVRNNLEIVVGLLSLDADKARDEDTRARLARSRARVQAMALLHEALAASARPDEIDFDQYLHQLADVLYPLYDVDPARVRLVTEITTPPPMRAVVGVALIAHELLANALAHAFGEGREGQIRISLARNGEDTTVLTVRDNGVGLLTDYNPADGQTVGLPLVSALTQQLGARLEIEDQGGVACRILLPGSTRPP